MAAGSFTWGADIKCRIDSRDWSQGSGTTTVTVRTSTCNNAYDIANYGYFVTLYKGSSSKGIKGPYKSCYTTYQPQWTGLPSGTYHFHLQIGGNTDDNATDHFSGDVRYP